MNTVWKYIKARNSYHLYFGKVGTPLVISAWYNINSTYSASIFGTKLKQDFSSLDEAKSTALKLARKLLSDAIASLPNKEEL